MFNRLHVGYTAPNFSFETPWKKSLSFHQLTNDTTSILIFLRYIGCPICQMEMANIKRNIHLANNKDAFVFVVLQSSPDTISSITNMEDWPFTIVCDPEAKIFQLYAVDRGNILKYLNPVGMAAALKAIASGHKHGKFEGIETQLPASFIIDSNKMITWAHYGNSINDIPSLETLVSNIK